MSDCLSEETVRKSFDRVGVFGNRFGCQCDTDENAAAKSVFDIPARNNNNSAEFSRQKARHSPSRRCDFYFRGNKKNNGSDGETKE